MIRTHFLRLLLIGGLLVCAACRRNPAATPVLITIATDTSTPRATLASTPRSTPSSNPNRTPFSFSQPVQPTPICAGAPVSRLIVQERGRVLNEDPRNLRMRSGPGTSYQIVAQIPINRVFMVLDGPVCGETYTWYYVRYRGEDGWIAEGDSEQYYVEPYLPG